MGKILITGGAGYIGSHVVNKLGKYHDLFTYDNLSTGHPRAVRYGQLIMGDITDEEHLEEVLSKYNFDAVIHFAAFIQVPESQVNPLKYYLNNVLGTLTLLKKLHQHNIKKIIFSSTAAVYGQPQQMPVNEETPINPINPYGRSKAMVEHILQDLAQAGQIDYVILRYFNVAGADPECNLGEGKDDASHLITLSLRTASGLKPALHIYGTDYPTPDGTCIRDYIHVDDLANAHQLALDYLLSGGRSQIFNCGYNRGYSVLEVVKTVQDITGVNFPLIYDQRRGGDPPILVADSRKIRQLLNWQPRFDHLPTIIQTAWDWEQKIIKIKKDQR